jgi:tetratricopeptide (TPR) repeat protein
VPSPSPPPGPASAVPTGLASPLPTRTAPKKKPRIEDEEPPTRLGNLTIPPFIDRAVALGKIEEGTLAINATRNEVAFNLCYAAAGNPQVRGLALWCMGEAEFRRGRYGEAIKWGKLALKYKASTTDVYLLLGKAYYKQKNCKEARVYYAKILNGSDSSNPMAQRGMELCKE